MTPSTQTTLLEIVHGRGNHQIDPTLEIWGWEIVFYLFVGGLVAGILVLAAALELKSGQRPRSAAVRWMPFVALGLLSLGMLALWLDLEHRLWAWRFYAYFHVTSPMSWGAWILLVVYPVGAFLGLGALRPGEREKVARFVPRPLTRLWEAVVALGDARRRTVLLASVVTGVGLGIYTGLLLGTMAARLQWNTPVLGPLFLASGISGGAALLLLFPLDGEEKTALVRWDLMAIGAELVLIVLMLVGFATGGEAARHAAWSLLGGPYTAVFWSLPVLMGLVVPLLMEAVEVRRHLPFTVMTPVLVLAGGLALRWVLLAAGQVSAFRLIP